jgi:predicted phosphohydrolase
MAAAHAEWIADLFGTLTAKDGGILLDELGKLKRSIVASLAKGA